jgi:hypothetical protein
MDTQQVCMSQIYVGYAERHLRLFQYGTTSPGELDHLKRQGCAVLEEAIDLSLSSPALKPPAFLAAVRLQELRGTGSAVELVRCEIQVFREWQSLVGKVAMV